MGRWAAVWVVVVAVGCWDPRGDRAREVIHFQEPERFLVGENDTLESIAIAHGITEDDILAWNDGVEIEPGTVLLIWSPEGSLPALPVRGRPVAGDTPRPRPRPGPRPAGARSPSPSPVPRLTADPDDRPRSVRSAGIFATDFDDGGMDDGLADAVAGLDRSRGSYGSTGLRTTSDMRATEAERSADMTARVVRPGSTGPHVGDGPITVPRLAMPPAKRCKAQGSRNTGEDGMYGGDGLSSASIKTAVQAKLGTTRRCFPSGTSGAFSIIVELNAGCDGRVKNTFTINGGGLPARVTDCIEKVLATASFPAHDLPDGQSFQYPINYSF